MRSTSGLEMSDVEAPEQKLGNLLARDEYVRRRMQPRLRDPDYLVLKDLYLLVNQLAKEVHGRVFDYGCGAAPYRTLFRHCAAYVAADVTPGPNVDRLLGADGRTAEASELYDTVLSTQVLEHVANPAAYLQECCRILKPGGQLILSTHGMIEEHGCPDDYYRWTSRGLETLLEGEGLRIVESVKFTTEIRAMTQLLHQFVEHLRCPNRVLGRYTLALVRRVYYLACVPMMNRVADCFPHQAIVPANNGSSLYVGICVRAEKGLA